MTPVLNIPEQKKKGLVKLNVGGISAPWYHATEELEEGMCVELDLGTEDDLIKKADTADKVIGLSLQVTYDSTSSGQMGQLSGYYFANDTAEDIKTGRAIGVLMGEGFAMLSNYEGTPVKGNQAYLNAATGKLTSVDVGNTVVPVWFDTDPDDKGWVRIRFSFPFTS